METNNKKQEFFLSKSEDYKDTRYTDQFSPMLVDNIHFLYPELEIYFLRLNNNYNNKSVSS